MLAVFHYLDRKKREDKEYWDWVASYGLNWGVLGLVVQPFLGLIYMLAIFDSNENAFNFIMHGPRGWEMLLMVGILTFLFLFTINFFIERREQVFSYKESTFIHRIYKWLFWIALAAGFILIQPAWLNATVMDYKYISLGILILIGMFILSADIFVLGDIRESHWGNLSKSSRSSLIMTGVLGTFIVIIMGYVRESARSPWTLYNIIPVADSQNNPTPILIEKIFIVWAVIIIFIIITFWLTSKVTAHHPSKAEEIK